MQRDIERPRFAAIGAALLLAGLFLAASFPALASGEICDRAAAQAAARTGVPEGILRALTRTETGRRMKGEFSPWPWSMNVAGKGHWFASRREAESYLQDISASGIRNFDVGCFQINYRWHGTGFASPSAMFDPLGNALYAARFLRRLYEEKGNWVDAAAAYHSRTPKYATRYRTRFEQILARVEARPGRKVEDPKIVKAARPNLYPLLRRQATQARALGSLVPMKQTAQRSFLALGG